MSRHTRRAEGGFTGFLIMFAVVVLIIVAGLAGCGTNSRMTSPSAPSQAGPSVSVTEGQIGQTLTFQDIDVVASSLREGEEFIGKPRTCVTIAYSNRGSDEADVNPYAWKLTTPQGAVLDGTAGGSDNTLPYAGVAPGGKLSGDMCFDVAYNAGPWVLTWEPSLWSNDVLTWRQG